MERRPCPHCEQDIPKDWDLCLYCGKKIEPVEETNEEIIVEQLIMPSIKMMF